MHRQLTLNLFKHYTTNTPFQSITKITNQSMNCKKENSTPHYLQGFNRTCCAYAPQQKHIKKHGRKKKKQLSTDMHVIGVSTSQINPDTKMVPCRAGWEVTTEQCSLALPGRAHPTQSYSLVEFVHFLRGPALHPDRYIIISHGRPKSHTKSKRTHCTQSQNRNPHFEN